MAAGELVAAVQFREPFGGALGNIIDRVRSGSVTDFVKLPLGWPPFNLADASITIGIVVLFLVIDHARHRSS